MSFDRVLRDELQEIAQLRRDFEDLKSTVLSRVSGIKTGWQSFTPTLTASTTNPTMGTGSAREGRYIVDKGIVIYRFRIQFGSSGAAGGNGEYRISVPEPVSGTVPSASTFSLGDAVLFDWSVAGHKELAVIGRASGGTALTMFVKNATVFHNNPFIWTNDDRFGGTAIYEAA